MEGKTIGENGVVAIILNFECVGSFSRNNLPAIMAVQIMLRLTGYFYQKNKSKYQEEEREWEWLDSELRDEMSKKEAGVSVMIPFSELKTRLQEGQMNLNEAATHVIDSCQFGR